MAGFKNSPLFNRFAEKPEALAAMSKWLIFSQLAALTHGLQVKWQNFSKRMVRVTFYHKSLYSHFARYLRD
jgi:hypothetical protein